MVRKNSLGLELQPEIDFEDYYLRKEVGNFRGLATDLL
jgi:hypothetical protein